MTGYTIFPLGTIGGRVGYNVEDIAISSVASGCMVVYYNPSRVERRLHENDILCKDGKYFKQKVSLVEVEDPFSNMVNIKLTNNQAAALSGLIPESTAWWYVIVGIIYEAGYTPLQTISDSCIKITEKDEPVLHVKVLR